MSPGPPSSSARPPGRIAGGDSGAASHIPDRLGPGGVPVALGTGWNASFVVSVPLVVVWNKSSPGGDPGAGGDSG
ncbi:MAG TPA: hypothetical protein VNL94_04885, partial [Candidatus Binatia bacterium]|nr:hypothetical protein [Candidatus Binatia bacterium]